MSIRNTAENYGSIAKWLHWMTAILFLGAYITVYFRHWFTEEKTPENWAAIQLHFSIGVTIAVIVALRIIWRITNRKPNPEPGTHLEHQAARVGHYALYAIMIIMPLTGYLGTGGATEYFFLFDIPKFEDTPIFVSLVQESLGLTFKEFEKPVDFIHKNILGAWLVWILILGHVLAALYHHFVKHDRTLLKMTSDK
ncbi:cytochrome b [Neptuniibacter marinus]|uniref:cytochrome b n=1 Tax=Neptuniibacter marinus TaxID=1806670 RepID=UPI00082D64F0|nr:cytochrome b [Neptuniibacter marinus]